MEEIIIRALAAQKSKEFILAHPEYRLNFWQRWREKYFLYLRKKNWPLAYLAEHKEFFGLDFFVNKYTLIPRPETELMVEETLRVILSGSEESLFSSILIDVGTGTGCIPISIAKNTSQLTIYAVDNSRRALRVARKNARRHETQINFIRGNLLTPFLHNHSFSFSSPLIITANLPYLTKYQFANESSIQKEPKNALIADKKNGLSLYKKLLEQIRLINQSNITLFLEINPSQTTEIKKIINDLFPKSVVKIKTDLAGRDRLVIIHFS